MMGGLVTGGRMRAVDKQYIGAGEGDLKSNRLGLLSAGQLAELDGRIAEIQSRSSLLARRCLWLAIVATAGVVVLSFARVLLLPLALLIELAGVVVMVYFVASVSRFAQQLALDRESEAVRIIKGRASRVGMRAHPLYYTLRVELDGYKVLEGRMLGEFLTGELYQLYVLPQSGVIIAAELVGEKGYRYLH